MNKTNNQIIAEFMGLIANPHDYGKTYGVNATVEKDGTVIAEDWVHPNYDRSWDSIMVVVDKIESDMKNPLWNGFKIYHDWIYFTTTGFKLTAIIGVRSKNDERVNLFPDKLSALVYVVVGYIEWFNSKNNKITL